MLFYILFKCHFKYEKMNQVAFTSFMIYYVSYFHIINTSKNNGIINIDYQTDLLLQMNQLYAGLILNVGYKYYRYHQIDKTRNC